MGKRRITTQSVGPFFIVLNVGSGKHDSDEIRGTIESALSGSGRAVSIEEVKDPSQLDGAAQRAVQAARPQGGVVVAAGGDGTINSVAQATLGSGCTFGVLPLGTFNYFSRAHGIPSDIAEACRVLLECEPVDVQVGLANERAFLVNASIGLYPQLLEEREQAKAQLGRSRLVAFGAALRTLFTFQRRMGLEIESAGKTRRLAARTLFVGNNRLQLERVGIGESEQVEHHKLAVVVLAPVKPLAMLGLLLRAFAGQLGAAAEVDSFALERLVVRPRLGRGRLKIATDGEVTHEKTPLVFRVAPHPLRLLRPRERREDPG